MRLFFWVLIMGVYFEGVTQCGLSKASYSIADSFNEGADTTNISILVSGALNNNLASTMQGVCAVKLKFKHPFMKELFVELISPSGQKVTLVGGDIVATNTQLITWDVTFVPCSSDPSPDDGILPQWQNDQEWSIGIPYTGQYHPYIGCLEQYNAGSVNGTWTLRCIDFVDEGRGSILDAELIFCQQQGINCGECNLDPGIISDNDIIACENDARLILNINKSYPSFAPNSTLYEYTNVIIRDSTILAYQQNVDLRTQVFGKYTICGIQWSKLQSAVVPAVGMRYSANTLNEYFFSQGACAAVALSCITVTINKAIPPVSRTEYICIGSSFQLGGKSFILPGNYDVLIENGVCDSLIKLDLKVIDLKANITSSADSVNCSGNPIQLEGKNIGSTQAGIQYFWSTQDGKIQGDILSSKVNVLKEGNYKLVLSASTSQYSCKDSLSKVIFRDNSFAEINLKSDTLTCINETINIFHTISKPVAEKTWISKEGNPLIVTPSGAKVTAPGFYILTIKGQNGCLATDSIFVVQNKSFIDPEFSSEKLTCSIDSVFIKVNHNVPQDSYTYAWSNVGQNYLRVKEPKVGAKGSYIVTISNVKNGCKKIYTVDVDEDKTKPSISIESQTINCNEPSINPKVMSDQEIASYRWTGSGFISLSPTPGIQQSGQYSLEITASKNGCKSVGIFELDKDTDVPNIVITADDLSCIIDSVFLRVTSDRPLSSISWSGPLAFVSDKQEPRVGLAGVYIARFTSFNGCVGTQTISIKNSPDIPQVNFKVDSIKCGKDTIKIKILNQNGTYLYKWSGPGLLSNNIGEPELNQPGVYFVTITNPISGCTTERQFSIVDDRIYTTPDIIYEALSCLKDSVQLILTNQDVKSILYTGPDLSTNVKSPFVRNTGIYTYFLVNDKNCVTNGSIEIIRNDTIPIIKASYSPIMCFQDSTLIIASSSVININYTLKGPENFIKAGNEVFVYKGGQYTLEGVASNGCKSQITFSIKYDTLTPEFSILIPDTITCITTAVLLKTNLPAGLEIVSWLPSKYIGSSLLVNEPGQYTAEVKGVNNCISRDTIEVFEKRNFPEFNAQATIINCKNLLSSVTIFPVTAGNNIQWENNSNPTNIPDNILVFNTSFDGEYKFKLTNSEKCTSKGMVIVSKDITNPVILNQISDTLDCNNRSIDIGVVLDRKGIEFLWNGPDVIDVKTDSLLKITQGGKYFLKVTGENFCVSISEFNIMKGDQKPEFDTFTDTLTCDDAKINIGVNSSTEFISYSWIGPDNFESDLRQPKVFTPGLYKVTVTGVNGCTSTGQINVTQDISKPQISIKDSFFLPCDTTAIKLEVISDKIIDKYKWIFPSGDIINSAFPLANQKGNYSVQVTGLNGCASVIRKFEVKLDNSPPKYTFTTDTISCLKSTASLTAKGNEAGISFEWESPSGILYFSDKVTTKEDGLFQLRVFNLNGCKDTVEFLIMADTIGPDVSIAIFGQFECESKKVILDASASSSGRPFQTSWVTVNGNISASVSDYIVHIDKPGTYTFEVKNHLNGCKTTEDITVNVTPPEFTDFEYDNISPICNEVNNGVIRLASFNGTAPYQIEFNGVKKGTQTEFFNLSPGIYSVVISDSLGCKVSRQIEIKKGLDLSLQIDKEIRIMFGDSLILKPKFNNDPSGLATLIWTKRDTVICEGCPDLWVRPFVNTIYNLEYSIDGFCRKSASVLIRVVNDIENAIPNVFAPKSSGNNQLFYIPQTRGIEKINYIKIFNRWAENVFSGEGLAPGDPSSGWDGTFNGKDVQPGVFIILAELVLSDGTVWRYQGDVTLIR